MVIKGIRIDSLAIEGGDEIKLTGQYSLMSEKDTVLAAQSFNEYSDIKVDMSKETKSAINKLIAMVKADITDTLGFGE